MFASDMGRSLNTYEHILSTGTIELDLDKHGNDSFPQFLAVACVLCFATVIRFLSFLGNSYCKARDISFF